jgi:nucleolar MIF4G domain-containing protein 1
MENVPGTKTKKPRHQISRKDVRKQDRLERKKRKAEFFSAASNLNSGKRSADGEHVESPKRKKVKVANPEPVASKNSGVESVGVKLQVPSSQVSEELRTKSKSKTKPKTALQKLATRSETGRYSTSSRSQKEQEDDAYIAYLESKLGYGKGGKAKKQAEEDDGLDGMSMIFFMKLSLPLI